jgi:hypothetical protein
LLGARDSPVVKAAVLLVVRLKEEWLELLGLWGSSEGEGPKPMFISLQKCKEYTTALLAVSQQSQGVDNGIMIA